MVKGHLSSLPKTILEGIDTGPAKTLRFGRGKSDKAFIIFARYSISHGLLDSEMGTGIAGK